LLVRHLGKKIAGRAKLTFSNKTDKDLGSYLFSLNPGLTVEKVLQQGQAIAFQRKHHLLFVNPKKSFGSVDGFVWIINPY
jgi:hypothetical protein